MMGSELLKRNTLDVWNAAVRIRSRERRDGKVQYSTVTVLAFENPRPYRTTPHTVNRVFDCLENHTDDKMGDQTAGHSECSMSE